MDPSSGSPLVRFYLGLGADSRGRRLEDILRWGDDRLEGVHDYIQWLFPLDEPSAFNPDAPLVSADDRDAFRTEAALATNLRRSFVRMLDFYGFRLAGDLVERSPGWGERSRVWMRPHNHNFLRLTRIIRSLALLGQPALARALCGALLAEYERAPDTIGSTTIEYWKAASRTSPANRARRR